MNTAPPKSVRLRLPLGMRLVNQLGGRLRAWGVGLADLSEESILRTARRAARLDDWGDERFRVPLRKLMESYESDPCLTSLGRAIARRTLIRLVVNRLRIEDAWRRWPAIAAGVVRRPLIVIGLPRTGTTLLHYLLTQDPNGRPLLFWESMAPAPPPDPRTYDRDPRIAEARRIVAALYRAVPDLRAGHAIDPCGPEECLGLLANTFITPVFRGRIPRYWDWWAGVGAAEVRAAYEEYRRQLLLLQWRVARDHWVLKCPLHLFGLDALAAVLPDACLVQTHRDPVESVSSECSLMAAMDRLSYETVDRAEVGARALHLQGELIDRDLRARAAIAPGRVFDLSYRELTKDPLDAVRRIYRHFGYEYGAEMEERMRTYLAAHPRHKHGIHCYSPEDFGLDLEAVRARFAAYWDRFRGLVE